MTLLGQWGAASSKLCVRQAGGVKVRRLQGESDLWEIPELMFMLTQKVPYYHFTNESWSLHVPPVLYRGFVGLCCLFINTLSVQLGVFGLPFQLCALAELWITSVPATTVPITAMLSFKISFRDELLF